MGLSLNVVNRIAQLRFQYISRFLKSNWNLNYRCVIVLVISFRNSDTWSPEPPFDSAFTIRWDPEALARFDNASPLPCSPLSPLILSLSVLPGSTNICPAPPESLAIWEAMKHHVAIISTIKAGGPTHTASPGAEQEWQGCSLHHLVFYRVRPNSPLPK